MRKNLIAVFSAALTLLILSSAVQAQAKEQAPKPPKDFDTLLQESRKAFEEQNWVRFYSSNLQLLKLRPYNPEFQVNIVLAAAQVGRRTTAYHYMLKMQQQGLSYDFDGNELSIGIRDSEAYEYLNSLLVEAGQPSGEGAIAFTLEGVPSDFSDIAWDASRERFLLGTRKEGKLLAVAADGTAEVLLQANDENGLWSINGIAVDQANNRLWLTSSATPAFAALSPTDLNMGALFEYALDTLEPKGRFNLPVDGLVHELGHLAVTARGDVYIVDWASPIVYRKTIDSDRLEAFAGSDTLVQLTDVAVTPDSSRVFVSDADMGILLIDPINQGSAMLGGPETLNLGGIFGLEFIDGKLIIMQSGITPQRLMRLELDANGTTVENVSPMAIALESFDMPGASTISGQSIYYLANQGTLSDADELVVMATPLDAGKNITPPDMRQFEKALKARQKQ